MATENWARIDALVTPKILTWARERAELDIEEAARKLGVAVARLTAWENGDSHPNFKQAEKLGNKLNIPFGYLYLKDIPAEDLPLADFRTVAGAPSRKPSPAFLDVLDDALRKQEWYHGHLAIEEYDLIEFVGKFSPDADIDAVAEDIRETLGINDDLRNRVSGWEPFLTELVRTAETKGILVLRSGIVGSNTYRSLSVSEFRGFTLSDSLAPLIFLNAKDARTAQIFTLVHEMAHLWTGQTGVSNSDYWTSSNAQRHEFERKADAIAAEALVPKAEFLMNWNYSVSLDRNISSMTRKFKVSAFVILRSALDLQRVDSDTYQTKLRELWQTHSTVRSSGGNPYANISARNSSTFTVAVVAAAAEGQVSYREAASLLNIAKLSTFYNLEARLLPGD